MNRHQKLQDILNRAKERKTNITTLIFLIATMNDKALTKFYVEFMAIKNIKKERLKKLNQIQNNNG
jgi:hypothetical protein